MMRKVYKKESTQGCTTHCKWVSFPQEIIGHAQLKFGVEDGYATQASTPSPISNMCQGHFGNENVLIIRDNASNYFS